MGDHPGGDAERRYTKRRRRLRSSWGGLGRADRTGAVRTVARNPAGPDRCSGRVKWADGARQRRRNNELSRLWQQDDHTVPKTLTKSGRATKVGGVRVAQDR